MEVAANFAITTDRETFIVPVILVMHYLDQHVQQLIIVRPIMAAALINVSTTTPANFTVLVILDMHEQDQAAQQ